MPTYRPRRRVRGQATRVPAGRSQALARRRPYHWADRGPHEDPPWLMRLWPYGITEGCALEHHWERPVGE